MLDLSIDVAPDEFGSEARKGREVCKGWFNADCKHTSFRHGRCSIQFDQTPNGQMENAEQVPALPSWLSDLLPQHDQRIGGVRHPPPLRVVVGLEMPDLAIGRQQQQFTAL